MKKGPVPKCWTCSGDLRKSPIPIIWPAQAPPGRFAFCSPECLKRASAPKVPNPSVE